MKGSIMVRPKRHNPGASSSGIWYYVYLDPHWIMMISQNGLDQHMHFWPEKVVPVLQAHYGLNSSDASKLKPLYASMPRGRVVDFQYGSSFEIVHGNDFPSCLSKSSQIKEVKSLFNLPVRTKDAVHEHEMMIKDHKKRLQRIIGKVAY